MRAARLRRLLSRCSFAVLAPRRAAAAPCRSESFEDAGYTVCSFDLTKDDLRMFWRKRGRARPIATFSALAEALAGRGATPAFAMNGGMYGDDLSPIGLYVEDGSELRQVNTDTVTGEPRPDPEFLQEAERRLLSSTATKPA